MDIIDISEIPDLINKLIKLHLPENSTPNVESFYLRLLSSSLPQKFSKDEQVSFFIMQNGLSLPEQSRLSLLIKRLKSLQSVEFRERILYILSNLKLDSSIAISNKRLEHLSTSNKQSFENEFSLIDYTRDLIFAFQGIESRNFSYSELQDMFIINSAVPAPLFEISNRLTELGWLFKKIQTFINTSINNLNSLILQSLAYSMQSKLNSFYKFSAILHNTLDNRPSYVKKIWTNYSDQIDSLKWLGVICDGVEGLKGGEIVSALFCYWRHGSENLQNLIRPLLEESALPLLQMIRSWMIEGELLDTFREFFIVQDFTVHRKRMWRSMFKLNSEMVPCFFSEELTRKVLVTGKSLYFLRKECREEEWSETVGEIKSVIGIEQAGSHWISRVSASTNEKLINVLFGKYRLQEHCVMVKKYLLMNQGDFHHALMEGIYSTLNQPAAKIYKHTLISILETAIKSSNSQYHDPEFITRLKIDLEDSRNKRTGWDIFALEYSVDPPLNTFFSEEICQKYRKIFVFLWKVKRVHFVINSLDKLNDFTDIQSIPKIFQKLKKVFFSGHQISHFINIFSSYLMVDSIDGLWEKFFKKFCVAQDLDELNRLHLELVDNVLESCFLSVEGAYEQILKILDVCLYFYESKENFIFNLREELKSRNENAWEFLDRSVDYGMISKRSFEDMEKILAVFPEEIIKFKEILDKNDSIRHKNLGVVLDFNEFYLHEGLIRGGYTEFFDEYKEVIQGLSKIARKY